MKRAATAWVLLSLFVLGSTPALADISTVETAAIEAALAEEAAGTETTTAETATETEALSDYETGLAAEALTGTSAAESQEDAGENTAPVAENQELETYRGVSVGGSSRPTTRRGTA
ncbi:MAG: hypothetical protein LUE22_08870 [Oscillospiraceae bacterium]|nr:hypothetical protein [Oscillospiraceae bacterium]